VSISIITAVSLMLPAQADIARSPEPILPIPLTVSFDSERARIGERLFHDVRLSAGGRESCASCHPLDRGGMDGMPVAKRPDGSSHFRNTPTVFNAAFNATLNWDGVAHTLEAHTDRIIQGLMGLSWEELISRLRADIGYAAAFKASYEDGITRASVLDAIAVFERSLFTPGCRFDRFLRGELGALSPRERRGYDLFKRFGCITCHQGVNLGGNLFQKFGVFEDQLESKGRPDPGRIRVTNGARDRGVFRVPSLRNVAVTAPYFHDGREPELAGAVELMGKAQLGKALQRADIELIVDFLKTLTGEFKGRSLSSSNVERGSR
jgi:cytochrome c peroxidase